MHKLIKQLEPQFEFKDEKLTLCHLSWLKKTTLNCVKADKYLMIVLFKQKIGSKKKKF